MSGVVGGPGSGPGERERLGLPIGKGYLWRTYQQGYGEAIADLEKFLADGGDVTPQQCLERLQSLHTGWVPGMDWCGPWARFRFRTDELERLCDGNVHTLRRGRDFPLDAPVEDVVERLRQAAYKRFGKSRVWPVNLDTIMTQLLVVA